PRFMVTMLLLLLFALPICGQRQTGTIAGKVVDKEGRPLPGATVSVSGLSLMGITSYITSDTGLFRFPSLPPGEYELRAEMPGFKTIVRAGLVVAVGKTTELVVQLEETAAEEDVTITAASPVVDIESSKVSVNYSARFLASLPINRDLYDIQNSIPGAVSEGLPYRRTSSILGGTVRGQVYALDGVPMNDPATFDSMININFDVYEEIEFEIGAHPAEVGQADSTYINIVSKSGGNKYSGGLTAYYTGDRLAADLIPPEDIAAFGAHPPEKLTDSKDLSVDLGGPLFQDRAWFFLTGRRYSWAQTNPGSAEVRTANLGLTGLGFAHYDYEHKEWLGFAKLTVQLTNDIRYTGMFHYNHVYEPVYQNSGGGNIAYENTAIWDNENAFATTHRINYILNQNTFLDVRGTYVYRKFPVHSRTQSEPTFYDYTQDIWWGASPYNDDSTRKKLLGSASITRFQDDLLGASHEFKAGAEFEQSEYHWDWYRGNPYYSYWDDYAAGNPYYYSTSLAQGRLRIANCPPSRGAWDVQDNVRRFSGYLQDSLTRGRLSLNLGLRVDYSYQFEPRQGRPELRYEFGPDQLNPAITEPNALLLGLIDQWHSEIGAVSPFDQLIVPLRKIVDFFTLSPRIGLVFDVFGTGKTAVKLSFGRYYEPVWAEKYNAGQIFAAGTLDYYWNDLNRNALMDLPPDDSYVIQSYPKQDPDYRYYVDDLKAPFTNEIMAGVEQEVRADFKLGLQLIWKQSKNIVEDTDINNGHDPNATDDKGPIWIPFSFIDPGWDGEWGTRDDRRLTAYGLRADRPVPTWMGLNPAEAKRKYLAAALTFDKRMSDNWQLKGSILYSSFKGNAEASSISAEGSSSAFNDPNTLVNAYGSLSFDLPLQIKIMGTYILPHNFVISAYFQHYSGVPWARTIARVYFPADFPAVQQTYVGVNAEPAGTRRRVSSTNLDLRVEKAFTFRAGGKLNLYLDIFNLAGRSGVVVDDNPAPRLRFDQTPPAYEVSPTYGNILSVFGVRSFRLGARLSF
ncbi:MAG: TonB-dependent receptor, partial [Acidobacteriota bacterium]